jgi:peptidoglycan hydrolase-like protein with peptidoglycan-binding domain
MEVLKLGSKGENVKILQDYLDIKVDGDFGPNTEKAVKEFQRKKALVFDGIVGKDTWAAMGYISTDLSENKEEAKGIDIIQYHLPAGEYVKQRTKKEWIFLHHTAGWDNPKRTIDAWAKDKRGPVATEFVLGGQNIKTVDKSNDGVLVQAFPTGFYGWHLGTGSKKTTYRISWN